MSGNRGADATAARALATAAGITTRGIERAVARLLADGATADAVVGVLIDRDLLADGVALAALVAAARRGVEHAEAMEGLAAGTLPLPDAPSDYEVRIAADEARSVVARALSGLAGAVGTRGAGEPDEAAGGGEAVASPVAVVEAAAAGRGGVLLDVGPLEGSAPGAVAEVVASLRFAGAVGVEIAIDPAPSEEAARVAVAVLHAIGVPAARVRLLPGVLAGRARAGGRPEVAGVQRSPRYVDVLPP